MSRLITRCPADRTIAIIGGRWKVAVLFHLLGGTKRFSELHRLIPTATHKVLTQQLRELEAHGVVNRKVYPQVPPKVEYSLTALGQSLKPVVKAMESWGKVHSAARSPAAEAGGS